MAFSAYNITNGDDAIDHLLKFHTNLDQNKLTVDEFIDTMDSLANESTFIPTDVVHAIAEDCKRNINFTLEDSINESSVLEFREVSKFGHSEIIQEALPRPKNNAGDPVDDDELLRNARDNGSNGQQYASDVMKSEERDRQRAEDQEREDKEHDRQQRNSDRDYALKQQSNQNDAIDTNTKRRAEERQYLQQQLLPQDVKKANELQPSLMLVNFYINDNDRELNVAQQFVVGVKSKLYAVESAEVINRVISKHVDSDIILKLVKVSTREISFVKDFLLGIDDAKLNATQKSRKGSGHAIFNALERRATGGKTRKALNSSNMYKAISTLVVSSDEVELLKKYNNINVMDRRVIAPIMDKLNLLYFVVADTVSEAVHIFTDGGDAYETVSFNNLEKEGDSSYKKIINLMTKVAR